MKRLKRLTGFRKKLEHMNVECKVQMLNPNLFVFKKLIKYGTY